MTSHQCLVEALHLSIPAPRERNREARQSPWMHQQLHISTCDMKERWKMMGTQEKKGALIHTVLDLT